MSRYSWRSQRRAEEAAAEPTTTARKQRLDVVVALRFTAASLLALSLLFELIAGGD